MTVACAAPLLALLLPQAALQPASPVRPTAEATRAEMGIPSAGDVRGQRDTVGFAATAGGMARAWETSALPPSPALPGPSPAPGVAAVICPHDDYLYAGRVYRQVLPLVTARTVVLVGVFHGYRRFGARDRLVFDASRAWRAPDGEVAVSSLREALLASLPERTAVQDPVAHDSEHSLEPLVAWLRHRRADLEIVPIIVPAASFERLEAMASLLGDALAGAMRARGWALGRDVAIAISTDGVHYGADFRHTPFGEGGVDAYVQAVARDRSVLASLAGPVDAAAVRRLSATFVDPADPDRYRLTWCGRFAVPTGLLLLARTASALGLPAPVGHPLAYATSVGAPELPLREAGMGETAPANLYHFVGYPAAAFH